MVRHMVPMKKNVEQGGSLPAPSRTVFPNHYKALLKEFADKQASVQFRHDALVRQRNSNYVGEHERIHGVLSQRVHGLPTADIKRLKNRQRGLEQLMRSGLGISEPLSIINI